MSPFWCFWTCNLECYFFLRKNKCARKVLLTEFLWTCFTFGVYLRNFHLFSSFIYLFIYFSLRKRKERALVVPLLKISYYEMSFKSAHRQDKKIERQTVFHRQRSSLPEPANVMHSFHLLMHFVFQCRSSFVVTIED